MEPDPWSWLTFTFAIISIGLATAIEFVFVGTSRSEIRKWLERSDSHSQLIDKLLGDIGQLSITVTLLKSIGLPHRDRTRKSRLSGRRARECIYRRHPYSVDCDQVSAKQTAVPFRILAQDPQFGFAPVSPSAKH